MKWRFTYKELTLLLGILVAVIILLTLWLKPFSLEFGEVSEKSVHKLIKPATKILAKKPHILITKILQ